MFRKIIKVIKQTVSIICKDFVTAIPENTSKYHLSDYKEGNQGSTTENLDAASQRLFPKKSTMVYFLEFREFFQNRDKEQLLVNSSEHIK